ncbi:MAG: DUF4834 family protein [Prolixibacteraceae bacterium]|jgi:hypothetical protein|nr:DUF4834 family protein [Prolixibacteraceae bacterium]NLX28489.1 DUF4834 family protein [Bacteroidales bacterium]HNQ38377.1 DUF4834 family protein [Prolixibacteraceae bacterium]HPJ78441.1 DUF4834 family protein [Prolixibacteraceae bacterium]HRV87894.1 DUF4834 family protein [Prolixibacteraceae bacterium]
MNLLILLTIVSFFRTLLIILIIWYGIKLVTRYIFPLLMRKTMHNMQSRMEQQFREQQRGQRSEGEVTIEKNRRNSPTKPNEGEYVDFEEVE